MRKWLWILFFPLAAQAAGEGMAGKQHGVTLSIVVPCLHPLSPSEPVPA
jgi:flagellar protein FlhE